MTRRKAVVTGALGVVGRAVVERLARRPGWTIVGVARRAPDAGLVASLAKAPARVEWVGCDLRDREATRAALAPHRDAQRLVFAALHEKPDLARGWLDPDHVAVNLALLDHTLAALAPAPLEHVALLQGTKAYGGHAGHAMRVPAREQDAIRDERTFYFAQQDRLEAEARRRGFGFTLLRPQIVLGVAVGSAMNPVATFGVWASVLRALDRPLVFPGHPHALAECVDARLVAAAAEWSADEPRAHGEAINLANGDVVVWRTLFARLAAFFDMPMVDEPCGVAAVTRDWGAIWREIAAREALRIADLDALIGLSWQYADALWANPRPLPVPALVSTIKARRLGFADCIDTEQCVVEHLDAMRRLRYLP